ncbi:hypothetical protein BAUCODRAFT_151097 [Baudoinia panamericana UAMH 10762]|uniref:Xylanolytic transcriptional activator regulatory domain-containing protein n=1 Tax=Baudoinia panamericana (strain UAMH 10762) TaxID=717646 RepID=M2N1Z2_BAUPA|nr:uncharacterized protein BAUCODRAFT_151097 [Baudoinia panamericana UAMH 10762]EMC92685.1 hypothetical protein BAUCODRAFT_151097 [Baudoinia panamericana UAMH 10762]
MDTEHAAYAIACDRLRAGCKRCQTDSAACTYSRTGVIRRHRKRKHDALSDDTNNNNNKNTTTTPPSNRSNPDVNKSTDHQSLQSHLTLDIDGTTDRLHHLAGDSSDQNSLTALTSLSDACAAVWHDAAGPDVSVKKFFPFEDRAVAWTETFESTLNRGHPLFQPAPPEVLERLKAAKPQEVKDRAWLVMFYSIVMSMVSSTDPGNEDVKAKLRCNLWLALNDVRTLLEPSETNIQALTLLSSHVEEFTTPSLCWMLATTACRMLQALGITHRRLDERTRKRRTMMFWHLNILDKGLALVFGRPPVFHRAMGREIPLPRLDELVAFKPHSTFQGTPVLFGAHFLHRIMGLSRLLGDFWYVLYDAETREEGIDEACEELEGWYGESMEVLEAAAKAEKPILDAQGVASIDLGLRSLRFQIDYIRVLLTRSSARLRGQCIEASKRMLNKLDELVSDSEEPFNGIVWQLVCCPFTPLLVCFGEVISSSQGVSNDNQAILQAMERLPPFLKKMSVRNSLAAKLERIAEVIVKHARSVVRERPSGGGGAAGEIGIPTPQSLSLSHQDDALLAAPYLSTEDAALWDTLLNSQSLDSGDLSAQAGFGFNTNDFLGDAMFDWIGWDSQL